MPVVFCSSVVCVCACVCVVRGLNAAVLNAILERNGPVFLKSLRVEKNEVWLQPENPDYPIINITEDNNFIIWGIVTNVIKKV